MRLSKLLIVLLAFAWTLPAFADATLTTHSYDLTTGSLADQLGNGPSLQSYGGSFGPNGYSFTKNNSLSLTGAVDPNNYSVEMVFSADSVSGWVKLFDFKNLTSDNGVYLCNGRVYFYQYGPSDGFVTANTSNDLIITRDGSTKMVNLYLNNVNIWSFVDSWSFAVLSQNDLYFMHDDNATGGRESAPGTIKLIRTYDGALNQAQVNFVDADGRILTRAPEPATLALVGFGLAAVALRKRRAK
ncbi:MAG: PEP-CTERM sorting domain-containing protein [Terriglobales bacterium]